MVLIDWTELFELAVLYSHYKLSKPWEVFISLQRCLIQIHNILFPTASIVSKLPHPLSTMVTVHELKQNFKVTDVRVVEVASIMDV